MKLLYTLYYIILVLFTLIIVGLSKSNNNNVTVGYTLSIPIPSDYSGEFKGKAYLMESDDEMPLNFRTAMSVEAMDGRYVCSLQVFLGSVMVWSSGHFSKFYATETCMLEFTNMGDLRLKGLNGDIGWKTGTSGQGVQKLKLLDTGNLVLVDAEENIKWQTFNFPTNILLLGQRLSVATHLTSFPTNNSSTSFFSFEIQYDKVALYLNSGSNNSSNNYKYSYWEFQPSKNRNITYIELASRGLEFFDDKYRNFSQIIPPDHDSDRSVRFLALDNDTGNLGFYYYSPYKDKLEASFQVLNNTCDLPLACSAYGICTFSRTCSCIRVLAMDQDGSTNDCNDDRFFTGNLCGKDDKGVMVELKEADSLLKNATFMSNSSKTRCANSCLDDCTCAAALYSSRTKECMFFDVVRGVKQVNRGSGLSYMVKVPKGGFGKHNKKSGLRKWALVLILVADGMVLFLVVGGLGYYLVWKRKKRDTNCSS